MANDEALLRELEHLRELLRQFDVGHPFEQAEIDSLREEFLQAYGGLEEELLKLGFSPRPAEANGKHIVHAAMAPRTVPALQFEVFWGSLKTQLAQALGKQKGKVERAGHQQSKSGRCVAAICDGGHVLSKTVGYRGRLQNESPHQAPTGLCSECGKQIRTACNECGTFYPGEEIGVVSLGGFLSSQWTRPNYCNNEACGAAFPWADGMAITDQSQLAVRSRPKRWLLRSKKRAVASVLGLGAFVAAIANISKAWDWIAGLFGL